MSDLQTPSYIDFLLYGSLENSDSDDSDYSPSQGSDYSSSQDCDSTGHQPERTLKLKLYHNYYIYMGYSNGLLESEVKG